MKIGSWKLQARMPLLLVGLALVVTAVFVVRHLVARPAAAEMVVTEAVARRDISQTVDATGTVQAIEVVEIKSKASGQISEDAGRNRLRGQGR